MKTKHIFIFGNNNLSILLHYYLQCDGINVEGFCLNKQYLTPKSLPLECYAIEDLISNYGAEYLAVYVTVAYTNMNQIRFSVSSWLKEKGVEIVNYFHPTSIIADNVEMGCGNIILENVVVQPFVKIGDCNIIWNNSTISHHSKLGSCNYFAAGVIIAGEVTVCDRTFWGCNSSSSNLVSIGNDVLVGAGAHVNKSLNNGEVFSSPKGEVWGKHSYDVKLK